MKLKRIADLGRCWIVIGFVVASLAFVYSEARSQSPQDSAPPHEFWKIYQNPDSLLPPDDSEDSDLTQSELNTSPYPSEVDSVQNFVYRSILRKYSVDTQFIRYLKLAEAAWIKYRDAEMLAFMPPDLPGELHGSMEAQCWGEYRAALTRERIGELLMWLRADEMDQTGCDTFYPESLLQSMRDQKNHKEK